MNRRTLAAVPALAFTLSACGGRPTHTPDYYSMHPAEAVTRVQICDRLAVSERDADCVNAQAGLHFAAMGPSPLDPSK